MSGAEMDASPISDFPAEKWINLGGPPEPSVREKLIMLSIEEIIRIGPADFNSAIPCELLGVKHPTINYHFGNRDGLIAEATMWAHDWWIRFTRENILEAPKNGKKRLRAFIDSEIAWAQKLGGMNLLMHYPMASHGSQAIVTERFSERMQRNFEYNLAVLTTIILDIRKNQVSSLDFAVDNYPKLELLKHPNAVMAATSISWATHGIASWSSGEHIATRNLENPTISKLTTKFAIEQYIKQIIKMAEDK
jgi:AcrR family transcriptional regulator